MPIVNVTGFRARSPFVTPEDGKNLNRCFPGDPAGEFSQVLAHHLFERVIRPSDALIDLHGGDLVEALEPFTLYDESPVQERAHAMAVAFGLRYLIRTGEDDAIAGTTSAAAAAAGIPAITPEAGGCGQLDEPSIAAHVAGIENTLRMLGVLDGEPSPPPPGQRLVRRFVWLRSPLEGWWDSEVLPGQLVAAGRPAGRGARSLRRAAARGGGARARRDHVRHLQPGHGRGRHPAGGGRGRRAAVGVQATVFAVLTPWGQALA